LTKSQATTAKHYIECLAAARRAGVPIDGPVADWLAGISDDFHERLVELQLSVSRAVMEVRADSKNIRLAAFLANYVAERDDVKPTTQTVYGHTCRCLIEWFGADCPLRSITVGDARDWRRWLGRPKNQGSPPEGGQGLAENTVRRRCGIAKQFFADAVDRELIDRNPFAALQGLTVGANENRDYFVTRDETDAVLEACPTNQWKLVFALSRYGGLRCPSEHLALRWGDVDFDCGKITVRSSKTERYRGKGERVIPLWPELRPYFEAVHDELFVDFDPKSKRFSEQPVITQYRDTNANLRTQLLRIIAKAKLTPWPKLFQNLRASRATELAAEFQAHVAAEWMGHSTVVADKHYWRVTEQDFERALCAAPALQQATEMDEKHDRSKKPLNVQISRIPNTCQVGDTGLEPVTSAV
jgi:integrase